MNQIELMKVIIFYDDKANLIFSIAMFKVF